MCMIEIGELSFQWEDEARRWKWELKEIQDKIKRCVNNDDPKEWLQLPTLCRRFVSTWELYATAHTKMSLNAEYDEQREIRFNGKKYLLFERDGKAQLLEIKK